MFDIRLDRRGRRDDALGEIHIGAHRESFLIDLSFWDGDEYGASWLRSAAHVLEHGYGRFLVSVSAPGQTTYTTWVCRTHEGEARLHKSLLLASISVDYFSPEEAETPPEDYAERHDEEPKLIVHRCSLRDIADFETRLRKASPH